MSLNCLPSDILFDIFTLSDNLQDLHNVVAVSKSLHQAFWDHRVGALQHVFRNQILKHHDDYLAKPGHDGGSRFALNQPTPGNVLKSINPVMIRYEKTRLPDRLILRSTAWATFIGFKSNEWVFTSLGEDLISLCRKVGRNDLALSYAAELWKHISTRRTFEYRFHRSGYAQDKYAKSLACDLAEKYYHDLKRPEDGAKTILELYDMEVTHHDYSLFPYILKYTRDMADPSEVLSFFRARVATERENLINNGMSKGGLHWIFCLTLLLSELGKIEDATCVFNNMYDLYSYDRLDPATLQGLSRRFIKSLKNQKYYDEAFTIHRQTLALLSRMHKTSTSQYIAWANQFISELYAVGRSDDALVVEKQCWNRLRERSAIRRELDFVHTGRAAAWALSKSYERRGLPELAMKVRWEYETLSKGCTKPGTLVIWPGEDKGERLVRIGNGQAGDERFLPFQAAHVSDIRV